MLRAVKEWESIYERIYPFLSRLSEIIESNYGLIKDRYEEKLKEMESVGFSFVNKIMEEVGFRDFLERDDEPIYVELRLIQTNKGTIRFSGVKGTKQKFIMGFVMDEIVERKEHEYDEDTFQRRLKAMADPTRFKIISLLLNKPYFVQELADEIHLTAATLLII